jgi:hypothetical protein
MLGMSAGGWIGLALGAVTAIISAVSGYIKE